MKNRKNYLKAKKKRHIWEKIGVFNKNKCPFCGENGVIFIYECDAFGCIACNQWIDNVCGDPDCPLCSKREKTLPYDFYWKYNSTDGLWRKMWRRDNYQHKKDGEMK